MKTQFIFLFLFVGSIMLNSQTQQQDSITNTLAVYYSQQKFDKIINDYSSNSETLSAKSLYYLGNAHYMKSNDELALKFLNLSIQKDNTDPDVFYIKGMTLMFMEQLSESLKCFEKSIAIDNTNFHYFLGKGKVLFQKGETKESLETYKKVLTLDESNEEALFIIPFIHQELGDEKASLEAFYKAKQLLSYKSDAYQNILYNIGVKEFLNENLTQSESVLKELITFYPEDYEAYSRLIQVYYKKNEYAKADKYINKLYEAHKKSLLKGRIKEMFCFDQFKWKDKLVLAYEKYEGKEDKLHYKHIFFITDPTNKEATYSVQTENSPILFELEGKKYVIGMDKENVHYTFPISYKTKIQYKQLKKDVLDVLNGKVKPVSSSTFKQ